MRIFIKPALLRDLGKCLENSRLPAGYNPICTGAGYGRCGNMQVLALLKKATSAIITLFLMA